MTDKKFFIKNVPLPKNVSLVSQIDSAAIRLHEKLIRLDIKSLGISEYNQRYLGSKLANIIGCLQAYSYLLSLTLDGSDVPLNEVVFAEYGGGSGVMSLLAKELGVGRVIYNDIYDVSCNDAKILARATNINVDDHVCGDIDELISYVNKRSLYINALSSLGVIEHIYDIEGHLKKLRFLFNNQAFRVVFASGANIKNPHIRRLLRKGHLKNEYEDKERKWGHKERDSLRSYLNLRKEMIANYEHALSTDAVEQIAKQTRGLMKHDIERCVDEYKASGKISYRPNDPTNTCDPYTGNWYEQLIDTDWLETILKHERFNVQILSGYYEYNSKDRWQKRLIKNMLNILIRYLGRSGLIISPYYVVYADHEHGFVA